MAIYQGYVVLRGYPPYEPGMMVKVWLSTRPWRPPRGSEFPPGLADSQERREIGQFMKDLEGLRAPREEKAGRAREPEPSGLPRTVQGEGPTPEREKRKELN